MVYYCFTHITCFLWVLTPTPTKPSTLRGCAFQVLRRVSTLEDEVGMAGAVIIESSADCVPSDFRYVTKTGSRIIFEHFTKDIWYLKFFKHLDVMDLLRSSFRTSTVQRVTRNAWVRCFHFWQRFDSEVHPTEMAIWRRRKLLALACTSRRNMVLSYFHAKFHAEYYFPIIAWPRTGKEKHKHWDLSLSLFKLGFTRCQVGLSAGK